MSGRISAARSATVAAGRRGAIAVGVAVAMGSRSSAARSERGERLQAAGRDDEEVAHPATSETIGAADAGRRQGVSLSGLPMVAPDVEAEASRRVIGSRSDDTEPEPADRSHGRSRSTRVFREGEAGDIRRSEDRMHPNGRVSGGRNQRNDLLRLDERPWFFGGSQKGRRYRRADLDDAARPERGAGRHGSYQVLARTAPGGELAREGQRRRQGARSRRGTRRGAERR